uniref:Putative plasmid maintenance system killer protein n=1 Tax=Magnetococcus massalia (strain MO-1) TaxID=451514 RepID=A0A1S7LFN3_MAGMO|nr:Putative plasmid maintenance system killer protein [Candidatus Magnetococcus massalia]
MIKSFIHKGLEKYYRTGNKSGIQARHAKKLSRILLMLDSVGKIEELDLPGYRLHQLKGERQGVWSVVVQANWRVIFRVFNNNEFEIVNYEDYN